MRLPPGITTSGNPPPNRATSVFKDGIRIGEYQHLHSGSGYRWRGALPMPGGYGDCSTAHLAVVAIVEMFNKNGGGVAS